MTSRPCLDWLSLLKQPYEERLGAQDAWDLYTRGGMPLHIIRGAQGMNNSLFRVMAAGESFACKLFVADDRRRAWREWTALDRMWRAGIRLAPEPVAFLPDGPLPQPAVVYRWAEGAPLAGQIASAQDLVELISALKAIHRAPNLPDIEPLIAYHQPPDYAAYLAEICENVKRVHAWAQSRGSKTAFLPDWVADLSQLTPAIGETVHLAEDLIRCSGMSGAFPIPALIRVDGNLDNILRDAHGQLAFVDWEYSGAGDPAYDLAELRWHPGASHLPDEWWEVALDDCPPLPGDVEFQKRLALYNRLLPIWWVSRSALYLLEGAGQMPARPRLTPIPDHVFRDVRTRIDVLLAFLGLL